MMPSPAQQDFEPVGRLRSHHSKGARPPDGHQMDET